MYTPPTRQEIESQIITSIEGVLGQSVPLLAKAVVRVIAKAVSGVVALSYQLILWAMRQIFPQTADEAGLNYLADWYGIPRQPATTSVISATAAGEDAVVIPAGTLWAQGPVVFSQRFAAVIASGTAPIELESISTGTRANLVPGSALSLVSPIAGITTAIVTAIVAEAQDQETLENFRRRVIQRMRNQPQGGSRSDYIRWATEVSGIAAALAHKPADDVIVYPLAALSGPDRIPDAPKLSEVEDYLQDPVRRPLCATVLVGTPTERTADVTITNVSPADAATKLNIENGLRDYFYAAYPRQFIDEPNPTHIVSLGAVWSVIIANAAVADSVVLGISGIGSGVSTYELPIGEIIKLGSVTWA
jgi:uncharacterized phage protein gp47/JayE